MTTTSTSQDQVGDNLFGVCAALGAEFRFNPLWLRLAFAVTFLANPVLVAGTYFALGAIVLVSRIAAPRRKQGPPATVTALPIAKTEDATPLPLAA